MMIKPFVLAVALVLSAAPERNIAPIPRPIGPTIHVPATGTVTVNLPTPARTPVNGYSPKDSVTVTPASKPSVAPTGRAFTGPSPVRSYSGCYTATFKHGMSLLWAKMSQTFCWSGGWITYYPTADCWGYDGWPSYNYMGCSTSHLYGQGWNQGRTTWHADLCDLWVPLWGSCLDHDYVNQTWYFAPDGSFFQIA